MQAAPIHQCGDWSVADDIHARANQRKSILRKVDDAGCLGDAAIEPGLHSVALGGGYVGRTRSHKPAHVAINYRFGCSLARDRMQYERRRSAPEHKGE